MARVTGSPTREEVEEAFKIHKFDSDNSSVLTLDEIVFEEKVIPIA